MKDGLNEKLIENLFNSYSQRMFPLGQLIYMAPTQQKEKLVGFDAAFEQHNIECGAIELLVQYKDSKLWLDKIDKCWFKVQINQDQLRVLRQYGRNVAFYVLPTFRSEDSVRKAQRELTEHPRQFLDKYIAIDAHSVPLSASRLIFLMKQDSVLDVGWMEKNKRKKWVRFRRKSWMLGSELLLLFKRFYNELELDYSSEKALAGRLLYRIVNGSPYTIITNEKFRRSRHLSMAIRTERSSDNIMYSPPNTDKGLHRFRMPLPQSLTDDECR